MGSPPVGMLALPPSAALSPSFGTTSIASQNHGFLRASSNLRRWGVDRRHLHHRSVLSPGQKTLPFITGRLRPRPCLASKEPTMFLDFDDNTRNPTYAEAKGQLVIDKFEPLSHEWLCGFIRRHRDKHICLNEVGDGSSLFGSDEEFGSQVPTQAQSIVEGSGTVLVSEYKPIPDLDYLQELLAIQQQGPRAIGFFGTRNMGFMHQQLIEILSYAMVITKNHIFTSGASGTNAAVIRGALRAEKPELLTVILPQSLKMQPPESQELLSKVKNVIEKPQNDHLPLIEASRLCNMDILGHVQQVICFAFHDSRLLMETCQEAKNLRKIVTLFYLD